jgi:hypothetical protein
MMRTCWPSAAGGSLAKNLGSKSTTIDRAIRSTVNARIRRRRPKAITKRMAPPTTT